MGRRASFRGRPGFLTVIFLPACMITLYMPWKLVTSADTKEEDYVQRGRSFDYNNHLRKMSEPNKEVVSKRRGKENDNDVGKVFVTKAHMSADFQQKNEAAEDKELPDKSADTKKSKETPKQSQARMKKLHQQQDSFIVKTVSSMEKYVHLDLNGAPPKMYYLQLFIRLIKRLGATGLLVEYQDMFPYAGILEPIRANHAYSRKNIKELIQFAKRAELTVMPLIPTFGQMEFVLKSEFSQLRERLHTSSH